MATDTLPGKELSIKPLSKKRICMLLQTLVLLVNELRLMQKCRTQRRDGSHSYGPTAARLDGIEAAKLIFAPLSTSGGTGLTSWGPCWGMARQHACQLSPTFWPLQYRILRLLRKRRTMSRHGF